MNIKIVFSALLCAAAGALASCSTETDTNTQDATNPDVTAKRTLSVDIPSTRSTVSLMDGNKWEDGDKFIAYNLTTPQGYDYITAETKANQQKLEGNVGCKQGDNIAVFYPLRYNYAGRNPETVELSMDYNELSKNGNTVKAHQDGTFTTLSNFDYSWGTIENVKILNSKATGNVQMKKLYAVLHLDFKNGDTPITNIKSLTIDGITRTATFNLKTGSISERDNSGITITPKTARNEFDVAVLADNNFSPIFTIVTTDNNTYTYIVSKPLKIEAAGYYPFTVNVTKPYIEINNVKWGKYNLQYTPGATSAGWKDGYHLAKTPWTYFYMQPSSYPLSEVVLVGEQLPSNTNGVEFDHYRWGDIAHAHDYNSALSSQYWTAMGNQKGKMSADKQFGDLAAYASDGKWAMPSMDDFNKLTTATAQFIAYYIDDSGNVIYGSFFDPTVSADKKGWILDANGAKKRKINQSAAPMNMNGLLRKLTKADFEKGIFFPMAGMCQNAMHLDKPGSWGAYWLSDASTSNQNQAAAFTFQVTTINEVMPGYTKSAINAKRAMYSIRPVYMGN